MVATSNPETPVWQPGSPMIGSSTFPPFLVNAPALEEAGVSSGAWHENDNSSSTSVASSSSSNNPTASQHPASGGGYSYYSPGSGSSSSTGGQPGTSSSGDHGAWGQLPFTVWVFETIVLGMIAMVACYVIGTYLLRRVRRRLQERAQRHVAAHYSQNLQERIEKRYITVEHWIITKKVLSHDEFCDEVRNVIVPQSSCWVGRCRHSKPALPASEPVSSGRGGEDTNVDNKNKNCDAAVADKKATGASSSSMSSQGAAAGMFASKSSLGSLTASDDEWTRDSEEDDYLGDEEGSGRECPICMNPLLEGEYVSWSPNPRCNHVYHHQCIKEWLVRHTGCPFCREIILPCDEVMSLPSYNADTTTHEQRIVALSERYSVRASTCYYCVKDGIVEFPSMIRCAHHELSEIKRRVFESRLAPLECAKFRGDKLDPAEEAEQVKADGGVDAGSSSSDGAVVVVVADAQHVNTGTTAISTSHQEDEVGYDEEMGILATPPSLSHRNSTTTMEGPANDEAVPAEEQPNDDQRNVSIDRSGQPTRESLAGKEEQQNGPEFIPAALDGGDEKNSPNHQIVAELDV